MAAPLPVWFLKCKNNLQESFASAAYILVRNKETKKLHSLLITAQHSLRTGQRNGNYYNEIQAWPPDFGFNDQTAVKVTLFEDLSPLETDTWTEPEDLIFLEVPADQSGGETCRIGLNLDFATELFPLEIVGFDGGQAIIAAHRGIVRYGSHPDWKLVGRDGPRAIGILGGGGAPPHMGASGGGVFLNRVFAGVYRGMYDQTGEHLFLPLDRIQRWCQIRNFDLINLEPQPVDVQVERIKTGVDTIAESTSTPGLPPLLRENRTVIARVKSNLALFNSYKQLHDGLHQVQFRFTDLAANARRLPETEAAKRADSHFRQFQTTDADRFSELIRTLPEEPGTVRALENEWLEKFRKAAYDGANALGTRQIDKRIVNKAVRDIRGVLSRGMPHLNESLSACARSMKLDSLTGLFAEAAKLSAVNPDSDFAKASLAGQESAFRLCQRLLRQVELHTAWQTVDDSFWMAEDVLTSANRDPETRKDQWFAVKVDIDRALALERDDQSAQEIWDSLEALDQLANDPTNNISDNYFSLERACRAHFYAVDKALLELAVQVAEIEKSLNNLLTLL